MAESLVYVYPKTHLLESIRISKGSLVSFLAEAIDNSFDANAKNIAVSITHESITVEDDGHGIAKDIILEVVTIGSHVPSPTTALGRWGIGIKYQAIRLGYAFEIETVALDGKRTLTLNWADMQRKQWGLNPPRELLRLVGSHTGTRITVSEFLPGRAPKPSDIEHAKGELAWLFYPAIAAGATITVNGVLVEKIKEPALDDIIDQRIVLPSGKSAHVRGGMLRDPSSAGALYQIHIGFRHRIIEPRSQFGCADYPARNLFARVQLEGSQWILSQFKDEVVDSEREALEDQVHDLLLPLLEKCSAIRNSARIEEFNNWVDSKMLTHVQTARPRKQNPQGRKGPKRKDKRPREIPNQPPSSSGPVQSRPHDRLNIDFVDNFMSLHGIGTFTKGDRRKPHKVQLAKDHPIIDMWLNCPNSAREVGFSAILALAITLYDDGRFPPRQIQLSLPGISTDTGQEEALGARLSKLLLMQSDIQKSVKSKA